MDVPRIAIRTPTHGQFALATSTATKTMGLQENEGRHTIWQSLHATEHIALDGNFSYVRRLSIFGQSMNYVILLDKYI